MCFQCALPGKGLPAQFTSKRFFSGMFSYVASHVYLPLKLLEAGGALIHSVGYII